MEPITDLRQRRGLLLAQSKRIKQIVPHTFYVPSASGSGGYLVDVEKGTCTCEDFQLRGTGVRGDRTIAKCKHLFAADYARLRKPGEAGMDSPMFDEQPKRPTYPQEWREYNLAQCEEKDRARLLLRALCDGVQQPERRPRGRQPLLLGDVVYAAVMRQFVNMSGRRAQTDLRDCFRLGYLSRVPSYNAVFEYLARPELTKLLEVLIRESAGPIAEVDHERTFATDSTGLSPSSYSRWRDKKDDNNESARELFIKLHAATAVRSKIITAAVATLSFGEGAGDSPHFIPLLKATGEKFRIDEALADKGYLSGEAYQFVETPGNLSPLGARCYIPFRKNVNGDGPDVWRKAYHLFHFHRDLFLARYSTRAVVESVFSSMKRLFGSHVRERGTKTGDRTSMINATLCRVIAYNLTVITKAIHTLRLDPTFWSRSPNVTEAAE